MNKLSTALLLVAGLAVLPVAAQPPLAYSAKSVHLRAGPARDYPVIAILPAGFEIAVQGCLNDYSWCDVIAGVDRGWVYAANISYRYEGRDVPVRNYAAEIGIAIIGFMLFDYWADHYRERSWYRDREHWGQRPRPPVEPPRRGDPGLPHPPPHAAPPGAPPRAPPPRGDGEGRRAPPPPPRAGSPERHPPPAPRPAPERPDEPGPRPPHRGGSGR